MANCQFLSTCGFFNNFQGNTEVVKQGWVSIYCKDEEKSNKCVRKAYRQEHGTPPVNNMSPTGKMIK